MPSVANEGVRREPVPAPATKVEVVAALDEEVEDIIQTQNVVIQILELTKASDQRKTFNFFSTFGFQKKKKKTDYRY